MPAHVHAYVDELERRCDDAGGWYARVHGSSHLHDHTPKSDDPYGFRRVDPPQPRLSQGALDARDHIEEKIARAKAAGRQCVSVDSESCEIVNEVLSASRYCKEAAQIQLPARLPTSGSVNEWRINVAQALLQASAYSDRAEVAWFRECSEAGRTLESFQDSGVRDFAGLTASWRKL